MAKIAFEFRDWERSNIGRLSNPLQKHKTKRSRKVSGIATTNQPKSGAEVKGMVDLYACLRPT